jgi:hypothetical protein
LSSTTNSDQSNTAETAAGRPTETTWSDPMDRFGHFPSKSNRLQCHVEVRVREWDGWAPSPAARVIVVCAGLCRIFGIILHKQ